VSQLKASLQQAEEAAADAHSRVAQQLQAVQQQRDRARQEAAEAQRRAEAAEAAAAHLQASMAASWMEQNKAQRAAQVTEVLESFFPN
jgi:hypothetical protein